MRFGCAAVGAAILLLAAAAIAHGQAVPLATGDARVDKLLSQMTLAEKLTLIHGAREDPATYQGQAGYLEGIPRLGIPALRFADGPPGVLTRRPSQAETATMGVAATFSRKTAEENGEVIGREARALGIDVSLQPFVNIDRDLAFSRGYNTFGEDPLLAGEIGAAEIEGIQAQHVMAMVKHFIGYDSNGPNIFIGEQALHEVYAAPFEAAVQAGVSSVMCSYNRINGPYACGNEATLTGMLRDEMGFKGFVTSDWGAVHSVHFINAGLDMEMPGPPPKGLAGFLLKSYFDTTPKRNKSLPFGLGGLLQKKVAAIVASLLGGRIPEEPGTIAPSLAGFSFAGEKEKMPGALKDGSVSEDAITRAAGRVLYEIARFGYLDHPPSHEITPQFIEENAAVIEKTGEQAAVLLKNEGGALPLNTADSIVLIGSTAAQVDAIGINGERSVGMPERQVGPFEALGRLAPGANIQVAINDNMDGFTIPASAFSHCHKPGMVRIAADHHKQTDPRIDFTGSNSLPPNSRLRWKGSLTVPAGGSYWLYLQSLGTNAVIRIDGKRLGGTGAYQGGVHGDVVEPNQDNVVPTLDALDNVRRAANLTAGRHKIEILLTPDTSNAPVQVRLNWYTPDQRKADHEAAIAAAKSAKVAVVFAWSRLTPVFGLPGDQDKLIEEVAAVNPNTIVVLNTSQPVAMPWVDKVKAVLEMWWPGDEGGWSTANLLLGKSSPAGRLPVTWGRRLEDYPANDPKHPERSAKGIDGKTTYSEGVNVGYRWFDHEKIDPLYPFGYGLSYTTFAYSDLQVVKTAGGGLDVSVKITNTGNIASDEVPQVYLGAPNQFLDGAEFPVRALVAFDRVQIAAGEARTVTLHVAPRQLEYWSTANGKWMRAEGFRTLSVGASSRDLRLEQTID